MFEPMLPPVNDRSSYAHSSQMGKESAHPLTQLAQESLRSLREFPPTNPRDKQMLASIHPDMQLQMAHKLMSDSAVKLLVEACCSLNTLNLAGNYLITSAALNALSSLPQLQKLNLASTNVTNLTPLINIPFEKLRELNLFNTKIDAESLLEFLRNHSQLTRLSIPENAPAGIFQNISLPFLQNADLVIGRS
ncbi:MAG: hypothetical protein LLG04_11110, partial [Parachlamydia sp.]|nr:hypothetical protein [Parachlamydia sp.]